MCGASVRGRGRLGLRVQRLRSQPGHRADGPGERLIDLVMAQPGAGSRQPGHRDMPLHRLHGKGVTGPRRRPKRGSGPGRAPGRQHGSQQHRRPAAPDRALRLSSSAESAVLLILPTACPRPSGGANQSMFRPRGSAVRHWYRRVVRPDDVRSGGQRRGRDPGCGITPEFLEGCQLRQRVRSVGRVR